MSTPVAVYLQDAHGIRQGMEIARYAESKGFQAIWQAESRLVREATVPMAAFLAVTDRIKVGSGVVNNWTRNPALLASTFSTLGRPRAGSRHPRDRRLVGAARRARSASTASSRCSRCARPSKRSAPCSPTSASPSTASSSTSTASSWTTSTRSAGPKDVPIYIGATGMQMMELAGEIADGVVLNYLVSPVYNDMAMDHLERGAQRGRALGRPTSTAPSSSCARSTRTGQRRSTPPACSSPSTSASSPTS